MKAKEEDGWVYGPEKDAEKKVHPCMVPYDQLPKEQRMKDVLFGAVVRAMVCGLDASHSDESNPVPPDEDRYHVRASNGPGYFVYARYNQEGAGKKLVMGMLVRAQTFSREEAEGVMAAVKPVFPDVGMVPVPVVKKEGDAEKGDAESVTTVTEGVPVEGVPG